MNKLLFTLWLTILPAAIVQAQNPPAGGETVVVADSLTAVASSRYVDPSDLSTVPRLVSKILVRATAMARRGEHAEAIALLSQHLADHPDQDHYLVRYHLARSHDALEQYDPARAQYEAAVALEPRLAAAWFGLGHAAYSIDDFAASGRAFLESFRRDADPQPETLYFAAAAYMAAKDDATAAPLLAELCSGSWGDPRQEWYAQLASCAINLGQPELAGPTLARYVQTHPDRADAWYLAYQYQVGLRNYREAAIALTLVGYLRELSPRERTTLGDLYNVAGVPLLAGEYYRTALTVESRGEDYERLASSLVAAHDLEGALNILREGLQARPTPRLWSLLGDVHYLRKDYAAAAEAFNELARVDPQNGRALLMVGYCQIELGNRGLAIQNLVAAAKFEEQSDLAERLLMRARKMDHSDADQSADSQG